MAEKSPKRSILVSQSLTPNLCSNPRHVSLGHSCCSGNKKHQGDTDWKPRNRVGIQVLVCVAWLLPPCSSQIIVYPHQQHHEVTKGVRACQVHPFYYWLVNLVFSLSQTMFDKEKTWEWSLIWAQVLPPALIGHDFSTRTSWHLCSLLCQPKLRWP